MTGGDAKLLVERVGPLATIQDLGRPGWFDSGVGVSGAADRGALRLANRLVGNPEGHAGIEVLLGGLTVRTLRHTTLAVTGAPAQAAVDGRPVGHASVLELEPDQVLSLGLAATGLRSYVAVRGGVDVVSTLGSRSRDTMSGIGPEPVHPGDELPIGPVPRSFPIIDQAPLPDLPAVLDIRVIPGPRDDWFVDAGALFAGDWTVSADVDRIGARLQRKSGPALERRLGQELPTEGVALGAIQVPPSGQPVVFLADHPITGGYPVIGVVVDADIDSMAQARPGRTVRFRRC
ncbi:biotin-dependent carboxyltransferase family protein [Nocardia cyriacigeorgica]|uniref:5-oxoprolinase subunit C family protein n=1 Tax=Nocardia cyriacigeorgica TaxID=135487 RepID=UPI002457C669|nr:biotin-dependent carboxyltransferase family protein [Nocardia cyriacigeorgica]